MRFEMLRQRLERRAQTDRHAHTGQQPPEHHHGDAEIAGHFLHPADKVGPDEPAEIADRVDQRDAAGRRRAPQEARRNGPERPERPLSPKPLSV